MLYFCNGSLTQNTGGLQNRGEANPGTSSRRATKVRDPRKGGKGRATDTLLAWGPMPADHLTLTPSFGGRRLVVALALSGLGLAPAAVSSANAQPYTPTAEDLALVEPILAGRVDVEPEEIIYVAPPGGPDGDGSAQSPRRDLISVVAEATAGQAIHLAPGVYDMSAIRDEFGHVDSALWSEASGEEGRPIVLRTDPELYDLAAGQTATLDFGYENDPPGWRGSAFILRHDYWVLERFEMQRMEARGFWVNSSAHDNTFRELNLHHANFEGSNNEALILMGASAGPIDNVVIGCHLHHAGIIDTATDELVDHSGGNGGCFYTETRLTYDSTTPAAGHDATRAEWETGILPPDGDVYLIGNEIHDCHYGLGLKNMSRGPYYFLSNYIHDTDYGVMSPFTFNTVRNNVIHDVGVGIDMGRPQTDGPLMTFLKMTGNAHGSEVSYNTVIGSEIGFRGGWSASSHNNLVIDVEEPIEIRRNQFYWWEDAAWPGIRGEFLIGDLDARHPFYDLMPGYMRETPGEFVRMTLTDNCYTHEPVIGAIDFVQPIADITGMIFDEGYTVLSAEERAALFVDEAGGDLRRTDDGLDCGSQAGLAREPGGGDTDGGDDSGGAGSDEGGTNDGADETGEADGTNGTDGPSGGGTGGSSADPGGANSDDSAGGCSCRADTRRPAPMAILLGLFALGLAARRRRARS